MDFLTQPFTPPSRSPPPPHRPSAPPTPSTSTSSSHPARQDSTSTQSSTSTPHSIYHAAHVDRFSALRTASPQPVAERPEEERVRYPSEKEGDWRAYGKVQARVMEHEREEGEWVVEGALWLMKVRWQLPASWAPSTAAKRSQVNKPACPPQDNCLLFLLDPSFPPLHIPPSPSPGSASSPSSPVVGFFKKLISPFKPSGKATPPSTAYAGGAELARVPTIETRQRKARVAVFPHYKGYPITALSLSGPSNSITALTFTPQQPRSPSSPSLSLSLKRTISGSSSRRRSSLSVQDVIGADGEVEALEVDPPVVEIEVTEREGEKGENLGRTCRVAFVFKEVLLAQEATTFHSRLSTLVNPSSRPASPSARFGATLARTLSGGLVGGGSAEKEQKTTSGKAKEKETARQGGTALGRRRSSLFEQGYAAGKGEEVNCTV
ncbi:hypothetical protein JCM10213v2_006198 [Rhodosporidiobolus nylandii]